jgi:hypothetical protein
LKAVQNTTSSQEPRSNRWLGEIDTNIPVS